MMEAIRSSETSVLLTSTERNISEGGIVPGIYKTIICPEVFYWCGIWSLTLREEFKLRVFENRVLRRIFGSERDEETGRWR
jgi:hypothetical protein